MYINKEHRTRRTLTKYRFTYIKKWLSNEQINHNLSNSCWKTPNIFDAQMDQTIKLIYMRYMGNSKERKKNLILATNPHKVYVDSPSCNCFSFNHFGSRCLVDSLFTFICFIKMRSFIKNDEAFEWTICQQRFELVKKLPTTTPILMAPNWSIEFHVHCDASYIAIGAVLAQKVNGNIDSPIFYPSPFLNQAEKNYSTTEREILGMIYSVTNSDTTFLRIISCSMWITKHYYI